MMFDLAAVAARPNPFGGGGGGGGLGGGLLSAIQVPILPSYLHYILKLSRVEPS